MRLFAVACLIGVVVILRLRSIPTPMSIVLMSLAMFLTFLYCTRFRAAILGCLFAILMLSATFLELSVRQLRLEELGVDVRLVVQVSSVPQRDARRLRFEAIVTQCRSCTLPLGPRRLQLSWYGSPSELHAGETWELTTRLRPMTGLRNPGGFDRVQWALASGIHARGYVRNSPQALRLHEASSGSVAALREKLAYNLSELPAGNDQLALVQALTLGVRHAVTDEVWDLLRQTGTAHLLAISGLHISLLAGWVFVATRWISGRMLRHLTAIRFRFPNLDPRDIGLLFSLGIAIVYALLAGFGLPTQRAVIMLAVWVFAGLRFRVLGTTTGLCLALLAVLLHNPLGVLSVGFWLSFGTVAALFYLHHGRQRAAPSMDQETETTFGKRILMQLPHALHMHILLGLLLLPVTAWFFQTGSLIAPLANLVAVPWVGIIVVPLCFLALLGSLLSPELGNSVLMLAQWSIEGLLVLLRWIMEFVAGSVTLVMPSLSVALLCLSGLLLLLAPRGLGWRWLAVPMLMPALLFNVYRPPMDGFEAHVLDVGQGLAVLVFSEQQTLLFDTGGKVSSDLSMFEAVVVPFLHSRGRRRIDTLVVSHGDEDHAFGVSDVLNRYPDVRLISSVPLATMIDPSDIRHIRADLKGEACRVGMQWQDGATIFSLMHPAASDKGSDNDLSCVLLVHHGASRVLLTGDIEAAGEAQLARRLRSVLQGQSGSAFSPLNIDLMVAPHHGSNTSSTSNLLETLRPLHIVFPSGQGNRYGFPHADVQSRYELVGAMPYITGTEGAVSFSFDRSGVDHPPSTWWRSHRSFWHGIVNTACSERFSEQSQALRLFSLAHKGQTLCGK
ncbi:DNA internalization-related competence protein ComEC/Rec2 [Granulosicoccus antarcticus]|uniref:Metallo-beta-lactamase domain-containing protein n=1 Tax=Granulosicoccus antarcticus IMCC3135 TaxID=1192854 RepID=A0A2Z2NYK8_9GAMM|nr:DNA internalization-related competence protein ComEC/Rec2 [Granulosicoccus antarcticus]ASJ75011.1 hypothetical protein IMCC3135_24735 [Granulosicoccus antarcticus IMCC3135]